MVNPVQMCASKNIHTSPMEGYWNYKKVRGISKAKVCKEYEAKKGARVLNKKNLLWEGYIYFFRKTQM